VEPATPEIAGVRMVRLADNQPQYRPIVAAVIHDDRYSEKENGLLLAFTPNDDDRQRIAEGADIYVTLLTFGKPMPPILVFAGKEQAAAAYGLRPDQSKREEERRYGPPSAWGG
jgi:hypothetical protein